MRKIVVIAHDIRSAHNVGALMRTAEGLGVDKIYFTGYTPYPALLKDTRLPHESSKLTKQIRKTALGAEIILNFEHTDIFIVIKSLKQENFEIIALEQTKNALALHNFQPGAKLALLLGREVEGIAPEILKLCDQTVVIPMFGKKESFNVVEAASMALYHCRFKA